MHRDTVLGCVSKYHDPGSPVTVYDRIGLASGALSGDKYLAVWDEQEQQYIFVLPVVCNCVASGGDGVRQAVRGRRTSAACGMRSSGV